MSKTKLSILYIPSGRAGEYANNGGYACNLYTGCPHGCAYCYSPACLHITREQFHSHVEPKKDCLKRLEADLAKVGVLDEPIFLCFSCDPYPHGYDCSTTREAIKLIKASGNNVRILTKNGFDSQGDFDLLDGNDEFGVTLTCNSTRKVIQFENHAPIRRQRIEALKHAHNRGIKTWVSFEPVVSPEETLSLIREVAGFVNYIKIGKLNYHWYSRHIDWRRFAIEAAALATELGVPYLLKAVLKGFRERNMVKQKPEEVSDVGE